MSWPCATSSAVCPLRAMRWNAPVHGRLGGPQAGKQADREGRMRGAPIIRSHLPSQIIAWEGKSFHYNRSQASTQFRLKLATTNLAVSPPPLPLLSFLPKAPSQCINSAPFPSLLSPAHLTFCWSVLAPQASRIRAQSSWLARAAENRGVSSSGREVTWTHVGS